MADTQVNLYDLNKVNYAKLEPLDAIWLNKKFKEIAEGMVNTNYWMLLCHENRDYTLFNLKSATVDGIAKDLRETLYNRGGIVDIEVKEDGAYEIWVKDVNSKEPDAYAFYLFDYELGVIECE